MTHRAMKTLCLVAAAFFLSVTFVPDVDAARLGGGKSFGGRSAYSRPAPQQSGNQAFSRQQTPGQNVNQAANPGMAPRSGFGGMIGGLLAGTLLGSLLFGGGGNAGFGMMDMLLVALVAFVGLKLFRAVMARREAAPAAAGHARSVGEGTEGAQDPWQRMRNTQSAAGGGDGDGTNGMLEGFPPAVSVPPGFDQEDFLRGAKVLFARLQDAWDRRDIADIASFATPAIVREVEEQAASDPNPSTTEVLLVNASLVSVEREGTDEIATVFFDVLIRENPEGRTPTQVRELWHFVRPVDSTASWRLDGIQQVS